MNEPIDLDALDADLAGLLKQATQERSHYYVGAVVRRCRDLVAETRALRAVKARPIAAYADGYESGAKHEHCAPLTDAATVRAMVLRAIDVEVESDRGKLASLARVRDALGDGPELERMDLSGLRDLAARAKARAASSPPEAPR